MIVVIVVLHTRCMIQYDTIRRPEDAPHSRAFVFSFIICMLFINAVVMVLLSNEIRY